MNYMGMLESSAVATEAETPEQETVCHHVKDALKVCREPEQEMKDMMTQLIHSSKSNYRFKASANGILVIIGTILIASPIVFTWLKSTGMDIAMSDGMNLKDLTNLNYFLGGIGIVAFVTTFYNKPQKQMTVAIGDLAQIFLICNMYRSQFNALKGKLDKESTKIRLSSNDIGTCSKDVIGDINKDLSIITKEAIELIDNCIEKYARDSRRGKNSNKKVNTTEEQPTIIAKAFR